MVLRPAIPRKNRHNCSQVPDKRKPEREEKKDPIFINRDREPENCAMKMAKTSNRSIERGAEDRDLGEEEGGVLRWKRSAMNWPFYCKETRARAQIK